MRCPTCGTLDGRVIDSRDLDDSTTVRRRRECSSCRARYTTYERVESARLIVTKTDGSREEFDRDKLADGMKKALVRRPVGTDVADEAADEIEAALRARGLNEVASSELGQMAMEKLRAIDHIAYIRFLSVYQSFDDIEQLKQEVDALYAERSDRVPGQTTLRLVAEDGAVRPLDPRSAPRRRPHKRK
ncbi:MAG: transcriptional regulator NrdR [Chloroflexota bacterium]|jgi:transcriptional repressor NrdR